MAWFRRFPLFSGQNWKSMGTKWIKQNQWRADFSCRYHFSLCILQALFQWIKCFYLLSILFKFTLWKTNAFRFADHHLLARPLGKHSILAKNAKKIIWAFNIFSQIWSVSILQGLDYSSSVEFHSILLAWLLMPLIVSLNHLCNAISCSLCLHCRHLKGKGNKMDWCVRKGKEGKYLAMKLMFLSFFPSLNPPKWALCIISCFFIMWNQNVLFLCGKIMTCEPHLVHHLLQQTSTSKSVLQNAVYLLLV